MFETGSDIFMTGNDIYGSGSKFGVTGSENFGTGSALNSKKPWFSKNFEIFVFQSRFCPWIRSKFKNRALSCTLSVFVAYSCKFSRRYANCSGRDEAAFTPICDCDLEIRSRSKILFSNGSPGQNIWAHKILLRYAENSVSEVDPRFEKKNGNSGYLNPSNQLRWFVLIIIIIDLRVASVWIVSSPLLFRPLLSA